ncbi:unnamed protein product [Schistosoma turkestanicum]|nr:unnamed protein product [Schistosoma turkestanicum]
MVHLSSLFLQTNSRKLVWIGYCWSGKHIENPLNRVVPNSPVRVLKLFRKSIMNQFGHQYGVQPPPTFYTSDVNSFGNAVQRPGPRSYSFELPPQDFRSTPFQSDNGFSLCAPQYYNRAGIMPSSDETCVNFAEQLPVTAEATENNTVALGYQNQFGFRVPPEIPNWMNLSSPTNTFYTDIKNHTPQPNPAPQSVYTGTPVHYNRTPEDSSFQNRGRVRTPGPFKRNRGGFQNRSNQATATATTTTTPASATTTTTAATTKEPSVFYCDICKVSCAGPLAFKDHESGQRHKKRLSQVEAIEKLKKEVSTDGNSSLIINSTSRELRCELCDVGCTGVDSYTAHLSGRQHQRTLKLHKELGKPIPETDDPLVPAIVADMITTTTTATTTTTTTTVDDVKLDEEGEKKTNTLKNTFMKHIDLKQLAGPELPAVGQEYLETTISDNNKTVKYRCKLCDCEFSNPDSRECHLRGRRHRQQYKKKVDPSFIVDPNPTNQLNRKVAAAAANKDKKAKRNELKPTANSFPTFNTLRNSSSVVIGNGVNALPYNRFRGQYSTLCIPQTPNKSIENRYISCKHASLLPTAWEVQTMMLAVTICERALKDVSNDLLKQGRLLSDSSCNTTTEAVKSCDDNNLNELEEKVGERLLCGVVRVGALGKNILLKGEHSAELVLVCSKWPTEELTTYVSTSIAKLMKSLESRLQYTVTTEPTMGTITIMVSCSDPSSFNKNDISEVNLKSICKENESTVWPTITLVINLTSPAVVVVQKNEIASEDITEIAPIVQRLITNGHPIPREKCIKYMDDLDHASWFQHIASGGPTLLISRILRDFIQSNDYWIELNEFDIEVHLDHLLSLEYNMLTRSGHPALGFTSPSTQFGSPRNCLSSVVPSDFFHPCKLLRRFFESIANGYLFFAMKYSSNANNTEAATPLENNNIPMACTKPFYITISNGISTEVCEKITVSAQQIVRQISFNQLYKVLGMEPINLPHSSDSVLSNSSGGQEQNSDISQDGQDTTGEVVSSVASNAKTRERITGVQDSEPECTPAKRTCRTTVNSSKSI